MAVKTRTMSRRRKVRGGWTVKAKKAKGYKSGSKNTKKSR